MGAFDSNSGKVSESHFKELLFNSLGASRNTVVCGPSFGVDTSIIDMGMGQGLAISSDPLSLIPSLGMEVSAWLSVHLLINDMATTGFSPQYAQFVLNLPTSLSKDDFASYWSYIHQLCKHHHIAITGGHTGQVPGQESTISGGGTMFLHAPLNELISSNHAQAGDLILMTKSAALSSSSLLAMAFPETVQNNCGLEVQQAATENFWQLSSLKEALIAHEELQAHTELSGMHDATEGGVLGAIYEMAKASGCGFEVELNQIPVTEETLVVTEFFQINPLKSIGAGSMIITVKPGTENRLLKTLQNKGIASTVVGRMTSKQHYTCINHEGQPKEFNYTGEDPYWGAFFHAINHGWK